jgi:hypothetical protein
VLFRSAEIGEKSASSCPAFYSSLRNDHKARTIIEFPGIVSWWYNPFHVYQRLHGARVLLGYSSERFGPFFGYEKPDTDGLRLRNVVDLSEVRKVWASGADFVVVHKSIYEEAATLRRRLIRPQAQLKWQSPSSEASTRAEMEAYVHQVREGLERHFGHAVVEDSEIAVYRVSSAPAGPAQRSMALMMGSKD